MKAVVICGREVESLVCVADRPAPGLGPLGGIAGALHHARNAGFTAILSVPCDIPLLPDDLRAQLGEAPAYVAAVPVIGLWPAALADELEQLLASGGPRSMRSWVARIGARPVALREPLANINTPEDLAGLQR